MKKIRITYVVTNLRNTGPINQTYNLVKFLDRERFEPSVITIWPESEDSLIDMYRSLDITIIQGKLNKKSSILLGKKYVTKCLKELRPDIVQGVGMPPYRMCLNYKEAIPYMVLRNYCYEDYPSYYGEFLGNIMAVLDMELIRKQLKRGYPITVCSHSLHDIYEKREGIDLYYIQNGVDISKFVLKKTEETTDLRRTLGLPLDKVIFVYSGGMINRKNQEETISAFLGMKNKKRALLLLLGNGPEMGRLKNIAKNDDGIIFKGNVTGIERYLKASDIYISSSKSEGLPNGVLEAMATGLPVILSDIPQHKEIIDSSSCCGYIYPLGNSKELSIIMDCILEKNLRELGNNAYNQVKSHFTSEIMSKKYSEYYNEIMLNKRTPYIYE